MARAKRKTIQPVEALDTPTDAQMVNGDYQRDTIIHGDTYRRETVWRNKGNVLERWIAEAGPGFGKGAVQVIRNCQFFWSRLTPTGLCAQYGERLPRGHSDGIGQSEALSELAHYARGIPAEYWSVFELVGRFDEPAGYAGSNFANNPAQQIQSAKVIVGFVASTVAARLGY